MTAFKDRIQAEQPSCDKQYKRSALSMKWALCVCACVCLCMYKIATCRLTNASFVLAVVQTLESGARRTMTTTASDSRESLKTRGRIVLFHSSACNLCKRLKSEFGDRITAAIDVDDPYWLPEVGCYKMSRVGSDLLCEWCRSRAIGS